MTTKRRCCELCHKYSGKARICKQCKQYYPMKPSGEGGTPFNRKDVFNKANKKKEVK